MITLTINNKNVSVPAGTTVAAAILNLGENVFRSSAAGQPRGPLCGMGICFECRVTIDNQLHQRGCNVLAAEGMEVLTDE